VRHRPLDGPVSRRFVHNPKEVIVRKGRNVEEIKHNVSVRLTDKQLEERVRIFHELLRRYGYWTVRALGELDREVYALGLRDVLSEAEKQGKFGVDIYSY
jgi:hypothetical protein